MRSDSNTENTVNQPAASPDAARDAGTASAEPGRQPFVHDSVVLLRAPSQAWSDAAGEMGSEPIHGFYHSDVRVLRHLSLTAGETSLTPLSRSAEGAGSTIFLSLAREEDDDTVDPRVRVERARTVEADRMLERVTVINGLDHEIRLPVRIVGTTEFSDIQAVKEGRPRPDPEFSSRAVAHGARFEAGAVSAAVAAPGADVTVVGAEFTAEWVLPVAARGTSSAQWSLVVSDAAAVVRGTTHPSPWSAFRARTDDSRLASWLARALTDLDGLRLTTVGTANATERAGDEFLAAGAPWFFTLFGRDAIWAARMLLPLGTGLPASTLRVLAARQGTRVDPETAEEPGKIMHELRRGELELRHSGARLPPLYYGTVDATALWICLLRDASAWGMPEQDVRALLPALESALAWMRDYGDSDGDGFLEYIDRTRHGLANQGWKDSDDSIQWRDGRLAEGPIALCEVQGYAYEAAIGGAELLDRFGRPGGDQWRSWAASLRDRFRQAFWIDDERGPYPAVALDAHKRPVDTVTSNIGHLLGTGILTAEESRRVAERLVRPSMSSGYGLRTLSTDSAGYWPLSYHGGSVWTHDTAIVISGLARSGLEAEAGVLIDGLLDAAGGFDYRVPELHSGDSASAVHSPVPYPAACRPQAWSASAAVAVLQARLGLQPDPENNGLRIRPMPGHGAIETDGLQFGGRAFALDVDAAGKVTRNTLR